MLFESILLNIMSWFGGKKNDDQHTGSSAPSSFSPSDYDHDDHIPLDLGGSAGGAAGLADLQAFSQSLAQQVLVNNLITEISDDAFNKCVTGKPSDSMLASKEVSCVHATVNKWMDTAEFMVARLNKKQQRASGGASF